MSRTLIYIKSNSIYSLRVCDLLKIRGIFASTDGRSDDPRGRADVRASHEREGRSRGPPRRARVVVPARRTDTARQVLRALQRGT